MNEESKQGGAGDGFLCSTESPEETVALGRNLGKLLKAGDLVCLFGELGAGKTCLARGLVQGMGAVEQAVTSPSFIMVNHYRGRFPIYHIDLYRLDTVADAEDIGLRDYLSEDGVALLEWASRIESDLPQDRLDIFLSHISATEREIRLVIRGKRHRDMAAEIAAAWEIDGI